MNSSVTSGATQRLRAVAQPARRRAADAAPTATAGETARKNLYRFPDPGQTPRRRKAAPASSSNASSTATALSRLDELAAELETALMSDLKKVAPFWGDAAPAMPEARAGQLRLPLVANDASGAGPASKDEVPQSDRLAIELLLARGRCAAGPLAPQAAPIPAADPSDQLADVLAERLFAAVDELRLAEGEAIGPVGEPAVVPLRRRFTVVRPMVAGVMAIGVLAVGAMLTVQSLTANPDMPAGSDRGGFSDTAFDAPADLDPPIAAKQSYARATEDESLSESPQLSGADLMRLPVALSPEMAAPTAYTMPSTAAIGSPALAAIEAVAGSAAVSEKDGPVEWDEPLDTPPDRGLPAKPAAVGPAEASGGDALKPARITSSVRLRGQAGNRAPTIAVLAPGTEVMMGACQGWCKVVAGDKEGFVFKRFLKTL